MDRTTSGETRRFAGSTTGSKDATPACDKILESSFISSIGMRPGRNRRTYPASGARRAGRRQDWCQPRCTCSRITASPPRASATGRDQLRYVPSTGVEAGFWWGELLTDQRPVDAFSLTYDSAPLDEPLAILGLPRVMMQVPSDAPLADWFVRLSDVSPDGQVTFVTGAGINGAQRNSMAEPVDLSPGQVYPLSWNCTSPHGCFRKDIVCASRFPMPSGR